MTNKNYFNARKAKLFSVIIPAFRQEKNIIRDVRRIENVLKGLRYDYEIIVVVDGFLDETFEKAKKIKSYKIRVLGYEKNHGKGYAIRYGVNHAKGDIIAFIDSGGEIDPNGLSMLLEHFEWYNADIIVGSKLHPVSLVHYPFSRKILSFGYKSLTKVLFGLKIRDTQAGMKIFRRKAILSVLPKLKVNRYAFDIEILALAHSLGYERIYEAPIKLDYYKFESLTHASNVKSIIQIFLDTMKVFYRINLSKSYKLNKAKKTNIKKKASIIFSLSLPPDANKVKGNNL